jgi:hypothetical protein
MCILVLRIKTGKKMGCFLRKFKLRIRQTSYWRQGDLIEQFCRTLFKAAQPDIIRVEG